ncbi:GNAT family N-acetyltransferase [Leptospira alexanderi]|uniref:GNAT family N-acetyltransferase n=1 Tax=Leptospira alexanderi TaxID=100053 RepID=UPI00099127F4|nr:GNAT family N-acetyltransferase [Leptospira alexanderi]
MDLPSFGDFYLKNIFDTNLEKFNCDRDLEKYFKEHAKDNEEELTAKTYFLHKNGIESPLVGFSLSNNAIKTSIDIESLIVPNARHKVYPAVLIGKFATHSEFRNQGYGRIAIDLIKTWFITKNKTGCRFIIVHSRRDAVSFYEKNQFIHYEEDELPNSRNVFLYFDLKDYELSLRNS